jgi:hypothetical protein
MLTKIESTIEVFIEAAPVILRALADGASSYRAEVNLLSGSKLRGWAAGIDAFRQSLEAA